MFSECGPINKVYIHSKPTSGPPAVNKSKFFPTAPIVSVSTK